MARTKRTVRVPDTIWEVDDTLWIQFIYPVIVRLDPPAATGRNRTDDRAAFNGIIYHMRTGCQWAVLPERFGSKSAVHRAFQRWANGGVLDEVWAILIKHCEELGGVQWEWQAADGAMGKARFGGAQWARTPRIAAKTARSAA